MTALIDPADYPLETRTGWPDALRVLSKDYPRGGWEGDPNFDGLIRFWLERHLMFRRLVALLEKETTEVLDATGDAQRYMAVISRYGNMLVSELHMHHNVEDHHYFPRISGKEPRVERGFAILDKDHEALHGHIDGFAEAANRLLRVLSEGGPLKDSAAGFRPELGDLGRLLDRHLTDEEELIVPVLLRHGTSGFD